MNILTKQVEPVERGCNAPGTIGRKAGKTYIVSDMKKALRHYPWGYFVVDPPEPIPDPSVYGMSAQGVSYYQIGDTWHVFDWIGVTPPGYPNAADILEEAFSLDGSTLVPITKNLSLLEPGKSRRFLCHPCGNILEPEKIQELKQEYVEIPGLPTPIHCFLPDGDAQLEHIHDNGRMCATLHWQHVMPLANAKREFKKELHSSDPRLGFRDVGETQYIAARPIENKKLKCGLAIVGWLPITELHVVDSPDTDKLETALNKLKDLSKIPIFLTNA
jgi:hypothetical protein